MRILVVDDEEMVREVVARYLERDGHEVETVGDGHTAARILEERPPDLVVLDIMLPGIDGLELLGASRADDGPPVILLSARADEVDRIIGLELGADDYVTKPFSPRELAARVRTVLRRAHRAPTDDGAERRRLAFDDLVIDLGTREVTVAGTLAELTPKEFDLLAHLACDPRHVFSREQLLEHVWDSSAAWQDPATVTVHVGRLRHKVDVGERAHIVTVWGVGYRFEP